MPVSTPIHAVTGRLVVDLVEHHALGGASRKYATYANYVDILQRDDTTGEYHHLKKIVLL